MSAAKCSIISNAADRKSVNVLCLQETHDINSSMPHTQSSDRNQWQNEQS